MQYTPTLEEVQEQLEEWRKRKRYRSEPIPQSLKLQIKQLISRYPVLEICNTLGLSNQFLYGVNGNKPEPLPQNQKADNFVPFRVVPNNNGKVATCTLVNTKGDKLVIEVSDVQQIIKTFLCYN